VQPVEGILLTHLTLKRVNKAAQAATPKTLRDFLAMPSFIFLNFLGWYLALKYGIFPKGQKDGDGFAIFQFFILMVGMLLPIFLGNVLLEWMQKPRREKVAARLEVLLQERKTAIEEAERFYSSPEWKILREKVIIEKGRICVICYKIIRRDFNLTVDHIRPRSKFPKLSLDIDNLQVMCRSCNSSKGDRFAGLP
jgi:hypothetical protein